MHWLLITVSLVSLGAFAFALATVVPSLLGVAVLMAPQVLLLAGASGLGWFARKKTDAVAAVLAGTVAAIAVAGSVVALTCNAFTLGQAAHAGLWLFHPMSWIIEAAAVALSAVPAWAVMRSEHPREASRVFWLALGMIAMPIVMINALFGLEALHRAMYQ